MAIIEPVRGRRERSIPECGLLLVNPTEAKPHLEYAIARGARRQFLFNSELVVDEERGLFLAGPAVGAPVAVMALEKLIALGAKKLILCGWCGAVSSKLSVGDVLVPDAARIGEGTSQYYEHCEYSSPSVEYSASLACRLAECDDLAIHRGCVWSTDGIYREERDVLLRLHRDYGVAAVDMEFSALCSAAAFRDVDFAASLIVSDLTTGKKWQPGFSRGIFRERKEQVLNFLSRNVVQI